MSADWPDIVARLALSAVVGAAIGLNRDLHHKQAGVRTNALVSLGAALAVVMVVPPGQDPALHAAELSRVIQGVLTGIGFLGAGVILRDPASRHVSGLTTAAAVWLSALLGTAAGAGAYVPLSAAFVLALVAIVFGGPFERWFKRRFQSPSKPGFPDDADT